MRRQALLVVGLLALLGCGLLGCGSTPEPPGRTPTTDLFPSVPDAGFNWSVDQYVFPNQWWDLGPAADSSPPGGADGSAASADGGACQASGAVCSAICQAGEVCAATGGGRCLERVDLTGDAADKQALAALVGALVRCWFSYPGKDKTCAALDTCQLTGSATYSAVESFVCKTAFPADLPGDAYTKAQEILNCGTGYKPVIGINRLEWKVSAVAPGEAAGFCVVYDHDGGWGKDRVQVRRCSDSP